MGDESQHLETIDLSHNWCNERFCVFNVFFNFRVLHIC